MRSQKATKKQNGKFYILTLQRYVGAEAEQEKEEFGREDAAFDGEVGEAICRESQVRGDYSGKFAGVELWELRNC
ncbi:hypothetical protein QUA81_01375 [Microcoleus sp. F6_B4]